MKKKFGTNPQLTFGIKLVWKTGIRPEL